MFKYIYIINSSILAFQSTYLPIKIEENSTNCERETVLKLLFNIKLKEKTKQANKKKYIQNT